MQESKKNLNIVSVHQEVIVYIPLHHNIPVGCTWLCDPFHPGCQVYRVPNCLEFNTEVVPQSAHYNRPSVDTDSHF